MKTILPIAIISALLSLSLPVAADVTDGTVLAHDRKANILVLSDKTVWALEALKSTLPAGLKAGDRITIEYQSDEEGVSEIYNIKIISN